MTVIHFDEVETAVSLQVSPLVLTERSLQPLDTARDTIPQTPISQDALEALVQAHNGLVWTGP